MKAEDHERTVLTREEFLAELNSKENKSVEDPAFETVTQILKDAREKQESRDTLFSDMGSRLSIGADITEAERQEISSFYEQKLLYLMSGAVASNSSGTLFLKKGHHGYFSKQDGKILFTHIWTDPIFADRNRNSYTFPGTITSQFTVDLKTGFELQTVEFSNNLLRHLILSTQNPPTPQQFSKMIQTAAKIDAEQNTGLRTLSREELLSHYPPALGGKRNFANEILSQPVQDIRKIPSIISAIVATNSLDSESNKSSVALVENKKKVTRKSLQDEKGKACYQVILTNPEFKIDNPIDPKLGCVLELPGTITINYEYEIGQGYVLKDISTSNATLFRFLVNTPLAPKISELDDLKESATMAEATAGLKLSKMDLIATLEAKQKPQGILTSWIPSLRSNPKSPDALEEIKLSLKALQTPHAVDQLEKDDARIFKDGIHISEAQKAEAGRYFDQASFGLPNFMTVPQTDPKLQVLSEMHKIKGNLFNNPLGETICRMEITNPTFSLAQGNYDVFKKEIPGKITLEYVFEAGKGFELRFLEFSSKELKELVVNPPKNPTPQHLEDAYKAAAGQENPQPVARPVTPTHNHKG